MNKGIRLLIALSLLLILIQALSWAYALPSVASVTRALLDYLVTETFVQDAIVTSTRWLLGWLIGLTLGVIAGFSTGRNPFFETLFEGFFTLLRAVPFICMVPLSVRIFGFDEAGKWFTVAWAVFFVTWVSVHTSAKAIENSHVARARSLRLTRGAWIRHGIFSLIGPSMLGTARTSLLIGLVVTAIAELAGAYDRSSGYFWSEGLGYRMFRALNQGDDSMLMASIVCFSLLGVTGDRILLEVVIRYQYLSERIRKSNSKRNAREARSTYAASQVVPPIKPPSLTVRDLTVAFERTPVFKDLSFSINAGETMAVIARSGAGKSSLIQAISKNLRPGSLPKGEVTFEDAHMQPTHPHIGLVFQSANVYQNLTVWNNALIGRTDSGARATAQEAIELIDKFGLDGAISQQSGTLSGGQIQRLALLSTLLTNPPVIMFDEPLGALDAITKRELQEFFVQKFRRESRATCLWVTHSAEEALVVADKIMIGLGAERKIIDNPSSLDRGWQSSMGFLELRDEILDHLRDA